jgi:hypothetical protein
VNGAHGFQFTPFGLIRGDQPVPSIKDATAPLGAEPTALPPPVAADLNAQARRATISEPTTSHVQQAPPPKQDALSLLHSGKPLTGKQLKAAAKARIKELDKMLATVPRLRAEREELVALVQATTPSKRATQQ